MQDLQVCKSCRSRQELSHEYLLFTCKIWYRYSRERHSQSLEVLSFIYSSASVAGAVRVDLYTRTNLRELPLYWQPMLPKFGKI